MRNVGPLKIVTSKKSVEVSPIAALGLRSWLNAERRSNMVWARGASNWIFLQRVFVFDFGVLKKNQVSLIYLSQSLKLLSRSVLLVLWVSEIRF